MIHLFKSKSIGKSSFPSQRNRPTSSMKKNNSLFQRKNGANLIQNRRYSSGKSSPLTQEEKEILNGPREGDEYDVVIVGGGPSGLSASIRLKQMAKESNVELRVCVVEKGAEVGSHILSGAVIEPRALNELIPEWKDKGAPLNTPVTEDRLFWLTKNQSLRLPAPPYMQNHGNYIISLANFCRWLGQEAESLGVDVFAGIAASEALFSEDGNTMVGIATGDVGIGKDGKPTSNFSRGMELKAKVTLIGEGCRGSMAKQLMKKYNLREGADPQVYGLGMKELWELDPSKHSQGQVTHTVGWPVTSDVWGGSFIYHMENNLASIGYVVGLDYTNPYLTPYKEFQRFKHHPLVSKMLQGGKCISYGARAINEGGLQSVPKLIFPGGALIGCSAGFLNVPKIKGIHNAMKSGMIAAEESFKALEKSKDPVFLTSYPETLKKSWVWEDLHKVRNVQPAFQYGAYAGFAYGAIDTYLFRGNAPWTFHHSKPDNERLKLAKDSTKIEYPKPDGVISFDLLSNLSRSGTNHNEDQPAHLKLTDPSIAINHNLPKYDSPETRYCPAGVYEIVNADSGNPRLQINAQNCLHCKTCDIKDPLQNINYTVPEGGGGPAYGTM
eukprot:TRINITY_DN1221_c0_g1_i1.p1 TRINITY_DN1221_c0_g1~~TRINITY_DN1221_c0_g1_i1.p1  ORF type:complete len:610 (+),score=238.69 TRINITY_DN1221_c0_g1_i1:153-1982(+)